MSAIDRLEAAKHRISMVASTVGFDILDENFKFNIISYISIFDCITYMIINGYDIKLFWGDFIRVCFCTVTWSFGYQCSARIIVFASKEKVMTQLYDQVRAFMVKMEKDMATNAIVRKFAGYIDFQCKGITIVFYLCGFMTILYPGAVYIFTKEIILPFGFVIPGLSDVSQPGYALNYCHHVLQVVLTVGGLVAAQCVNIVFLLGACLMIEVLIINWNSLEKELLKNDDDDHIEMHLKEIVKTHQEIIKFVQTLESLFSLMFLVDVFAISFQVIIILMVESEEVWVPGGVILLISTAMLLIDCVYGLYIEIKFDALCHSVYDISWHLMSPKNRKTIVFILARSQRPPLLTFGKVAPMNMVTFVTIYKSIYSYFMVLKSFEA